MGSSPQHLLPTLLGEYFPAEVSLPSVAMVAMLSEFGISESSARTALSRLTSRGLIEATRTGRQASYRLTPGTRTRNRARRHHFMTFGARSRPWTGDWTVVSFSLPEQRQAQRHNLRRTLGQSGFVRLYDSVWIRPGRDSAPVTASLSAALVGLDDARWSVMEARFPDEAGPQGPAAAFDLEGLAARYEEFIDRFRPEVRRAHLGLVDSAEALVARTEVMDAWRDFADTDPDLPAHLLPADWPRSTAREVFLDLHGRLGPLAEEHLRAVIAPHSPEAATLVTHFVAPAADGAGPPSDSSSGTPEQDSRRG
ncbi:PaaX family transcriptional regulator C-terminal domain-containing protein [Geodermatophilus sp. CPCC 206100]|uniref:PaaX family transcriptional regulator n=1 Tax=Geodermatophilus sp. CPCC 206100 TaxID=3020054 RepID=UPI003B000537